MSFAETGAAVEEKRVVAAAGGIDNAASGGDGKIVVGADDEVIQGVFLVEIGEVGLGIFEVVFQGFDPVFQRGDFASDFAGTDAGFGARFHLEFDGFDLDIVVGEGGLDEVEIAAAELADEERVFHADADFAIFGGDEGGILEPGSEVAVADFLLDFS